MRQFKGLRGRPQSTPYHQQGAPPPIGFHSASIRGVNFRFRVFLAFCVLIILGVLLANVLFIRRDSLTPLKIMDFSVSNTASQPRVASVDSVTEREFSILERLQQEGHRGPIIDFPQKLIHLDLKGAPLNVNYLEEIMPLLRRLGSSGLLIEYEDMFPFDGPLEQLSARNAYSKDDIKRILRAAKANDLIVIPLVQTFGHMEFVLKLAEHKGLREVDHNPQAICPTRNGSTQLIHEMLRQVISLHQGHITHLHIGCDEVFVLGECEFCFQRMTEKQWTKADLFVDHVSSVVRIVNDFGLQTIMWDDMFRGLDEEALVKSPLVKLVEVMVWNYSKQVQLFGIMANYVSAGFRGIWVASAFKGATAPNSQMPEFETHLLNHHSWVQLLHHFGDKIYLKGIAITGWQRFDHFGSLCELFPVGLPVLAICLAYLQNGRVDAKVMADVRDILKCSNMQMYQNDNLGTFEIKPKHFTFPTICDFPASNVIMDITQWSELKKAKQRITETNYYLGWMSNMNRGKMFSSPEYVNSAMKDLPEMNFTAARLEESIRADFAKFTDNSTIQEWIVTFLKPIQKWIEEVQREGELLLHKTEWPRRPLY